MSKSKSFVFNGGAATYFGTAILASLITLFTFGVGYPWALCLFQKWKAKHTYIEGRRLRFTGGGFSLIGLWIKWLVLLLITLAENLSYINQIYLLELFMFFYSLIDIVMKK